jgi:protein-S-isoprenylcysteine O-methyltransferase Ste14
VALDDDQGRAPALSVLSDAGLGLLTLHHLIEAVVLIVLGRHLQGAARTFSLVKGERPTPALQLFGLANGIVIYKAFVTRVDPRLAIPGLFGFACSLALFEFARRTIRGKFFSYAFSHDLPQFLLTSGPYSYIRNPFYASYLLAYVAAAILFPGITTLGVLVMMGILLTKAARYEERKFQSSPLAKEYEAYKQRTGRFIPRLYRQ